MSHCAIGVRRTPAASATDRCGSGKARPTRTRQIISHHLSPIHQLFKETLAPSERSKQQLGG